MIERPAALASIAIRHAGAYTDLILSDIDVIRARIRRRMFAAAVVMGSSLLAAVLGCVWVIAATWDTAARTWAIAGLLGVFVVVAACAFWKLNVLNDTDPGVLSQTAREWAKDRHLLEELLCQGGCAGVMTTPGSDTRAQTALLAMQRNRAQFRAACAAPAADPDAYPRSATFRWIAAHLSGRSLASSAVAAVLVRAPLGRLLGRTLVNRRV